jgi:CubicO group peptidase (beta-lactamase class C family)
MKATSRPGKNPTSQELAMRHVFRLRPFLLTLCAALALQSLSPAQTPLNTAAVDTLIQDSMKAWSVPGAAIAIVRGNEVIYLKGHGLREIGGSQAVTPDTLFAIASTSKAFTTCGMAMLVDDGKMKWDDPVRKYVESFHLADPLADENVTLRDLITHRTGLSRNDLLWLGTGWGREEIIQRIGLVKLTQPYRSTYQYQNIMFLTAGYAAGKASGGTWEDFTKKRIFEPLGIKGANFSVTDAVKAPDHATPHAKFGVSKVMPIAWRNVDNIGPAGSINAGVRDLSRWVRFQLGDGTFEGKRLLSERLLQEMHAPQLVIPMDAGSGVTSYTRAMNPETNMMSYGLGWTVQDYRGQLMISHGGSLDGFRAQVVLLPKQKIGIVVLSNLGGTQFPEAMRNILADHLLGAPKKDWNTHFIEQKDKQDAAARAKEKTREAKRHANTKPSRELTAYVGTYEDPAYGKLTVSLVDNGLSIQWYNVKTRLEHFHYDTFTSHGDLLVDGRDVIFVLAADGEVSQVNFIDQEFKRVKAKAGS